MSKLSNIKRALDAQLPFQERLNTVAEAAGCTLEQGDFVMWGGVTVAISTSRGDWETGDITEYLLINIRGLCVEKMLMTHCTLHDVPFITHDKGEEG